MSESVPPTPEAKRMRPQSPLTVPETPEPTQAKAGHESDDESEDLVQVYPVNAKITYKEADQVVIRTMKVIGVTQKMQLLELVEELLTELNEGKGIKSCNVQLVRME